VPFYASLSEQERKHLAIDSVGYSRWAPWRRHVRRDGWHTNQFMYTLVGEGVGDVEGESLTAALDTVWLMPKTKRHNYRGAPGCTLWEYRWIEFDGDLVPGILSMLNLTDTYAIPNCSDALPLIDEVVAILDTGGHGALPEAATLFVHALSVVARCARPLQQRRPPLQRLDQAAKRYLHDHMHRPVTLSMVAAAVRVSPQHVSRVFKKRNGMSPMAYLRRIRVDQAKSLLAKGRLNISEVGRLVGYPVLPHFSRMFKRETGLSPRAYVRQL